MRKGIIKLNTFTLYGRVERLDWFDDKYSKAQGTIVAKTRNGDEHYIPFTALGKHADKFLDVKSGDAVIILGQIASGKEGCELWVNSVSMVYSNEDCEIMERDLKKSSKIFDDFEGMLPDELPDLKI